MKKNKIKIVFAVIILLLLVGGTVLLALPSDNTDTEKETASNTEYTTYTVFKESIDNVKEISVDFSGGKLSAKKDPKDTWTINDLGISDIDTSKSRSFAEAAINIVATTRISENAENLVEYGLDTPSVTVTVTRNDDTTSKILIGDVSPVNGNYFAKNETDTAVYLISSYKVETLTNEESYYTEFERFSIADVTEINEIIIERPDTTIALSKAEGKEQNYYDFWNMTSPIETAANFDYISGTIFEKVSAISLSKPISGGDFGFDKPTATLMLKIRPYDSENQQYKEEYVEKLVIGKLTQGKYYVQYEGKVYQISAESLEFINSTVLNLSSKLQAIFNISDVERVDMTYSGATHTLQILHMGEDGTLSFKINGNDIDPDDAKKFYQQLIGVLANGMYNGEALGKTVLTLSYKGYNGAADNTVEFKALNDLECAIVKNGKAQFTVSRSIIDKLIETINLKVNN